jgi:hypothetical protein
VQRRQLSPPRCPIRLIPLGVALTLALTLAPLVAETFSGFCQAIPSDAAPAAGHAHRQALRALAAKCLKITFVMLARTREQQQECDLVDDVSQGRRPLADHRVGGGEENPAGTVTFAIPHSCE